MTEFALRRPKLVLVVYCLVCWLPGWFGLPATDRDESRFAQATKQMTETGDVVSIFNGTVPRNRKPIGIHWLQLPGVVAAEALGWARDNPIWPYRLPSFIGALLAVLTTYAIGRRSFGNRVALLGAAMLAGGLLLGGEARIAKTDAALLGATTLAMAVLARAYLSRELRRGSALVFWAALGVAILLKGPVTPMIVGLAVLTLVVTDRRGGWLAALRPGPGIVLLLLIVLPWFVAIGLSTHGAFFRDAVGGDLAGKVSGGDDSHGAPPGTHLLLLSATMLPVGWAVLSALPGAWAARRDPAIKFLLAWTIPAWLVFEAVPTKLPHYILPLLPPLCLLAGRWAVSATGRRWWLALSRAASVLAAILLGLGAAAVSFVVGGAWWLGLLGLIGCGPLIVVLAWPRVAPSRRVVAALVAAPVAYAAILGVELPNLAPLWLGPRLAAAVAESGGAPGGIAVVGMQEPSVMFALGTGTQWLSARDAAGFVAGAPGRVVVVEHRQAAAFAMAAPDARPFAEVDGFDYSNGHHEMLRLYRHTP